MFLNKQILVVLIITALGIVLIAQITLAPSYLLHAQSTSGEGQNTSSGGEEPMFDLYGNIVTAAAACRRRWCAWFCLDDQTCE